MRHSLLSQGLDLLDQSDQSVQNPKKKNPSEKTDHIIHGSHILFRGGASLTVPPQTNHHSIFRVNKNTARAEYSLTARKFCGVAYRFAMGLLRIETGLAVNENSCIQEERTVRGRRRYPWKYVHRRAVKKNPVGAALALLAFLFIIQNLDRLAILGEVAMVALPIALFLLLPIWRRYKRIQILRREISDLTPYEFEEWVAALFSGLYGWTGKTTKKSGDQGADVVVIGPNGIGLVIQCKHYCNAVGNKAVQEVVAARALYKAQRCIVATSSIKGYTKSARELAKANDVLLWTPTELASIKSASLAKSGMPAMLLKT